MAIITVADKAQPVGEQKADRGKWLPAPGQSATEGCRRLSALHGVRGRCNTGSRHGWIPPGGRMSTSSLGKVVVNRAMSLDGFIAGPDHAMDWILEYTKKYSFPEVMAATGAMLVGRGTYEVSKRMSPEDTDYEGGPVFVLTHQPPDEPGQGVTFLSCDLAEAVDTARAVAGGKNLEILGADLASQCLRRGLVDEVLVY